ncbi:DUF5753 domain-containing protein [Streptomyces sp. N2-109]|uniref:DUF5753 domain-containing protein n=1 Tax=Streptomyces gossypii TaxID=2883101 RepID=A0ABT2JRE7_9ACTN|nr:DUF5753 domain-containing protein [Streptomyces gossypii]MCT2590460.1 DUF5753 domain-containing protein [Streptomyces gossypii]
MVVASTDEDCSLAGMTGGRTRGWWEEYREILSADMLDLAELERHATAMRIATAIHMPGLLQTRDHAYALISEIVPSLAPHEVEHRVSYRIKKQAVLHGASPTPYTAIIHEAALRMGFGGSAVARAQLQHLIDMSEREKVTVLVVPFGVPAFPGSGQAIVCVRGPVPRLDTINLDTDHGTELLDAESKLAKYRTVMERMEKCALTPVKSRDYIRGVARQHTTQILERWTC